jgi:cyclopropane fatty-acyl-phospholipid synthase-like methyltransferase
MKNTLRNLVYPGLDLHVHSRRSLLHFWKTGPRRVLDAGSGNGYFSWLAYQSGADVLALNFERGQVEKASDFLNGYHKADPKRLEFRQFNLYDLSRLDDSFDEIICFETLEHIKGDEQVCREFFRLLKPGGVLHVCCPHAQHPRHEQEVLDTEETGGHVRCGYTEESYRQLLEPIGFRLACVHGLGTATACTADKWMRKIRKRFGDLAALPLLPLGLTAVRWTRQLDPAVPFSIYAQAVKPGSAEDFG